MSNGCGCERGVLRYVRPPYARLFYAACCVHDDDYDRGGGERERLAADRLLFGNMVRVAWRVGGSPWRVAWLVAVALGYYAAVRVAGRWSFNYREQ